MSRNEGGYLGNRPTFAANVLPGIWTLQEVYDRTRFSNWYTNEYYYQQSTVGHHQIVLTQEVPYLNITLRGGAGGSDNNLSDNAASPCSADTGNYGKGGYGGIVSLRYTPSTPFQAGQYISFIIGDIGTHSNAGTSSSQVRQQPNAYQGGEGGCVGGGATWLMLGQFTETQMKNSGNESQIIAVAGGGGGAGRRGGDSNTNNCGGDGGNANISSLVVSSNYWGYGQGGVPGRHASNTQTTRGGDGHVNGGGNGAPGYYSGGGGGGGGRGGGGAGSTCSYCGNQGGAGGNIGGSGSSAPYGSTGGTYLDGGNVGSSGYGGGGGQGLWGGGAGSVGNGSGHAGGGGGGAGSSYIKVTSLVSNPNFTTHNNRTNSGSVTLEYP